MADLSPAAVQRRLARLRELYVPETLDQARVRLEAERPRTTERLVDGAKRRLADLRALDEFSRALHRARWPDDG
ncbi:hypothetical protein [Enhygromyxa salina]|uniref:Uncharacterized protein n=1 Tax=Enhygromyxa salina TaxID=215803 RepID=A0A2S9XN66_9BACT|nr:hypothetical protein [Enhygromyxa salina]PRP94316.1 hypothetical protein ENSA7_78530 [Enhygromyxa salina]